MDLQAVRDLRADLRRELTATSPWPAERPPTDVLAETTDARWTARRAPPPRAAPPVALGITHAADEGFRLAVHIQREELLNSAVVERIRRRAGDAAELRYVGKASPAAGATWHTGRHRPLRAGSSIGPAGHATTGTLGCFVRSRADGELRILSNHHVLTAYGRLREGEGVRQPGADDGGEPGRDLVAEVAEVVPLQPGRKAHVDCAAAKLVDGVEVEHVAVSGAGEPDIDDALVKDGRTTGSREGRVLDLDLEDFELEYPKGVTPFDGILAVDGVGDAPFARRGDSGSLVVRAADRAAIGLVFAVTDIGGRNGRGVTYVCPIAPVLEKLGVELVASVA